MLKIQVELSLSPAGTLYIKCMENVQHFIVVEQPRPLAPHGISKKKVELQAGQKMELKPGDSFNMDFYKGDYKFRYERQPLSKPLEKPISNHSSGQLRDNHGSITYRGTAVPAPASGAATDVKKRLRDENDTELINDISKGFRPSPAPVPEDLRFDPNNVKKSRVEGKRPQTIDLRSPPRKGLEDRTMDVSHKENHMNVSSNIVQGQGKPMSVKGVSPIRFGGTRHATEGKQQGRETTPFKQQQVSLASTSAPTTNIPRPPVRSAVGPPPCAPRGGASQSLNSPTPFAPMVKEGKKETGSKKTIMLGDEGGDQENCKLKAPSTPVTGLMVVDSGKSSRQASTEEKRVTPPSAPAVVMVGSSASESGGGVSSEALPPLAVGLTVDVKRRMQPGFNKPGGIARITNYHPEDDTYDVRYIVGTSRERGLPRSLLTPKEILSAVKQERNKRSPVFLGEEMGSTSKGTEEHLGIEEYVFIHGIVVLITMIIFVPLCSMAFLPFVLSSPPSSSFFSWTKQQAQ